MKDNRPVNLDISTIKLPITAYASILHRISGVAVFVGIAVLLCLLDSSLQSAESFDSVKSSLTDSFLLKAVVWLVVSGLIYHTTAGVKHLIMDLGIGETLEGGKKGATITLASAAILIVLAGVWIW
ncbi:Succinate dehydrogenase cytochrome b556 subunit [BD1-7 clade bacterium]|uniref:Succinate dehydrogenase cytochrome b556 subunit n=1 Tax=BD1-7 clade bacterium TaxID=2029982 RepID=A0A5S9PVK2_9GAMM|nr:Succinate dehydrogenase cytochrome b556 subunit [BD1-7 clade bacterium]CAA0109015.1 Succinate dehydrogenase cytochrome b556 subunit [BD1-7 clade bacterium]CAA0115787.1 Succinate dehydrogenase cytochrome b556 subunit [BD1-7 clade bacterium]CAA0119477.1 Succinate dehydrogenase cytochrome b556 subunit [BD1-7 clade bacterium]